MNELLKTRPFGNMWGLFYVNARLPEYVGRTLDECLTKSWLCDSGGCSKDEWANHLKASGNTYRRVQIETSTWKK